MSKLKPRHFGYAVATLITGELARRYVLPLVVEAVSDTLATIRRVSPGGDDRS